MTSVQNRLLPLSGSKSIYCYIVVLLMFLSSCRSTQKATAPEKRPDNNTSNSTIKPKAKEEIPNPSKTEKPKKAEEKKQAYTISYLLPFQSNKVDFNSSEEINYDDADMAIEYFNGAKLALDSLKTLGYNLHVNVFDSQNDSAIVAGLVQQFAVKKSDIIFGPVYPNELAAVAKFSSENKVITISPLSPASLDAYKNPWFVMANNSLEQHAERLAVFTKQDIKAKKVIIISTNPKADARYMGAYKKALDSIDKSIEKIELATTSSVLQYLDKTADNIIFIPTSDQAAVITIFKYLNTLDPAYKMTVLGHPKWFDLPNLDIVVMQKLKVCLTTSFSPDYFDPNTIAFVKRYRNVYGTEPREFAFKGFDHTFYFGGLLVKDGKDLYKKFSKQKVNSTTFDFKQKGNYGYQNQYLHVVKFENDQLTEQK